jgi:hypothetical protein
LLKDSIGSLVIEKVFKHLCQNVTYWGELILSGGGKESEKEAQ